MILMFIAGWIAGVIGTLMFGKWMAGRINKDDDERT